MANKVTGVRIDPELWRQVRMAAIEQGETASSFVEKALRQRLGAWAPVGGRRAEPIDMAADTVVIVGGGAPVGERSPDTRCECGVAWGDHQSGASKRLAVRTNCRSFRAAS